MKTMICICMMAIAAACTAPTPSTTQDSRQPSPQELAQRMESVSIGATADDAPLIEAAVSGDPDVMARAAIVATAAACHGTVTCPGFGSCGTWSSAAACGATYCNGGCGKLCPIDDPECEPRYAHYQPYEVYRVCTNAGLNQCVEWKPASPRLAACSFTCN